MGSGSHAWVVCGCEVEVSGARTKRLSSGGICRMRMHEPTASATISVSTACATPPSSYHACVAPNGKAKTSSGVRMQLIVYMSASRLNIAICSSSRDT